MYPWIPIAAFFAHEIDAAAAVERSDVAVAILAAELDQIVPPERTSALRKRIANLVYDRTIVGAGHNDIYARSEFQEDMRAALSTILG
jgi:pimeloyl-ACP methyl ester carboxylesterase